MLLRLWLFLALFEPKIYIYQKIKFKKETAQCMPSFPCTQATTLTQDHPSLLDADSFNYTVSVIWKFDDFLYRFAVRNNKNPIELAILTILVERLNVGMQRSRTIELDDVIMHIWGMFPLLDYSFPRNFVIFLVD